MYDYALVAIGSGGSENTTDMVRETSLYSSKREREDKSKPQIKWWRFAPPLYLGFYVLQQIPIKPTTKQPIEKAQSRCHNDETN